MKNYIQVGNRMDWVNSTGGAVLSGALVFAGLMPGVAVTDIANGATGAIATEGVFRLDKTAALAIAQGDQLFWNDTTKKVTKTNTDKPLGIAWIGVAGSATTVDVKLLGASATMATLPAA